MNCARAFDVFQQRRTAVHDSVRDNSTLAQLTTL